MSNLTIAAYYACGMNDDEATAMVRMESTHKGNSFIDRGYCSAEQRMIIKRMVFNGRNSFVEFSAAPN